MKISLLLPVLLTTIVFSSFRNAEKWVNYVSTTGHFSIEFPGTPTESTEEDTSDTRQTFVIHFATFFPNDTEGYMTDWIDMSKLYPEKKTIKQILEDSRDGALRSINATFVKTTAIMLGKEPFIEFSFTNKEFAGKGRIYVMNKFQYSIITLFSLNAGISADGDRFIHSFKHT
jgi:hypothetical protein